MMEQDEPYKKVKAFLRTRNIDHLINTFMLNKIDDTVAPKLEKSKLMEMGLAYGDTVIFQQFFGVPTQSMATYHQKKNELKKRLQRAHTGKSDRLNRPISAPISFSVTIGIKCLEKVKRNKTDLKYTLKANKSITVDFNKDTTYNQLHNYARNYFQIPDSTKTFIAAYKGNSLEDSFETLHSYALKHADKKKAILLYLYYPKTYAKLEFYRLVNKPLFSDLEESDEEDNAKSPFHVNINENRNEDTTYTNQCFSEVILPAGMPPYNAGTSVTKLHPILTPEATESIVALSNNTRVSVSSIQQVIPLTVESPVAQPCSASTPTTNPPSICEKCHCTYYYFCLICQQNDEFEKSLVSDSSKDVSVKENEKESDIEIPNQESIRQARLNHFFRVRKRPIRYRHSIGSPSYSYTDSMEDRQIVPYNNHLELQGSVVGLTEESLQVVNKEDRKVPMINSTLQSSSHDVVLDSIRNERGIANIESIQNRYNYDNQSSIEIDLSEFETLSERNIIEAVDGNSFSGEYDTVNRSEMREYTLKVRRTTLRKDLIDHFADSKINPQDVLTFIFIDPRGNEELGAGEGVTREVYSTFWSEIANGFLIGEKERVPYVRHDLYTREWESIGKILVKGYSDVNYFPPMISRTFMSYCMFDEATCEDLLASFGQFISPDERDLMKSILDGDVDDFCSEEVLDFLEQFKCRSLMTKDNAKIVLEELARQELIQKPFLMASCWKNILSALKSRIPSKHVLYAIYAEREPSCKKLLNLLSCSPANDAERDSLSYLKRYIRGLDSPQLCKLLKFLTGADQIICSSIRVTFIKDQNEFSRRPIAHTCGPTLELPSTYHNFCELREEFSNIISQNIWGMDIV